ncbi:MAG: PQQ-binding-like beta-propeller repeat protein, partial [Verrucomicrobiota bacterium]
MKAGDRFYAGGAGEIAAYEIGNEKPVWEGKIAGDVYTMLAGDDRLFVLTQDGLLHCFGAGQPSELKHHPRLIPALAKKRDEWTAEARQLLEHTKIKSGYALVLGLKNGRLVEELVEQSDLHVDAVENDAEKVDQIRRRLTDSNVYGERASVILADPEKINLPPYFAKLIVSEKESSVSFANQGMKSIRPYGGVMVLDPPLVGLNYAHVEWENLDEMALVKYPGALPESDDWTHQYANAAQTVVSRDKLVKAPLGILWFGGPSHAGILPRHGHGPSPQVAGGRLFIEGPDMLRAVDVYTGELLWERDLPGLGTYYNTTAHFPGAGEIGSNYVSLPDRVYAAYGREVLELDAETGEPLRQFRMPGGNYVGFVSVSGNYVVTTAAPIDVGSEGVKKSDELPPGAEMLIGLREEWKYLPGDDAPEGWTKLDYDDADWKRGKAGFGYGDGDDKTEIKMRGEFSQVRIRREFEATGDESLILRINYDDGFIAYINGQEIARRGVSEGRVSSHEASGFENIDLEKVPLLKGRNVLALEGHNTSKGSSDFTLDPVLIATGGKPAAAEAPPSKIEFTKYSAGSRRLVVFDRNSGEMLWEREAEFNFRHNNIAVTDDRVFCIDSITKERASALSRRGVRLAGNPAMYALKLDSGEEIWKHDENVFGTFLNYSSEHDIVIQGGSKYRDRAADEAGNGLIAIRGLDGDIIWSDLNIGYGGPCLLWKDKILTNGAGGFAIDIKTGEKTGWEYSRKYGCNTAIGSEHLLTFRSGAAGFYDLFGNSGAGNLGGFRSSCTNNLIPANGVLNAPDYTRTCSCSYQNQTSLALIHMPDAEFWTFGGELDKNGFGINFGAPGDRRSDDGILFAEFPNQGADGDK